MKMKILKIFPIFAIILALSFSIAASNELPAKLERDPFNRPNPIDEKIESKKNINLKTEPEEQVEFELRSTLVSGQFRIANINGILLKAGDTIEKHNLLEIHEGRVILEKNGKKIIIPPINPAIQRNRSVPPP